MSATGELREPLTVPTWWVNTVVGIFLLPLAWVLAQTFFSAFSRATVHHGFWLTEEFWFFGLGMLLWTITFFGLPRPLWIYVFGHEATHALWVILMGGRVSQFKVTSEGGHILTNKHNVWIALAPYFFPLYSAMVIAAYGCGSLFWNLDPYNRWLFALIGVTWGFHITFTLWMIPKGQSDLTYYGTFFSLVIIFMMNLLVLTIFLVTASPDVSWASFGRELLSKLADFCALVVWLIKTVRAL